MSERQPAETPLGKGRPRAPRPPTFEGRLGARIEETRKGKGLSADELAEKAGVGRATVIRVEAGAPNPAITTILAIANALGLSGEQLLRKVEDWTAKPRLH
jgi:transcriptional regulator with XRE-family HTH domain